jgi:hypothetical protein
MKRNYPIEPMTLGNMRENGVRSLVVSCSLCHHEAVINAAPWPDHIPVPTFGPRMVCTRCGIVGADARRIWHDQRDGPRWIGLRPRDARGGRQRGSSR